MINVEVQARNNESNNNLIRRFSRKFNSSGISRRARSLKSHRREKSDNVQREQALKKIKRNKEIERLIKLGKLPDRRIEPRPIVDEENE
ncbi:MAG: hypothetical protein WDZ70_01320 [Candidatus Paceibacterota bacterium]